MDLIVLLVYAYLVGSIPTAYLIGRWVAGIDIRRVGTGNVGGANVWFHVGRKWVLPLALFEVFGKGASPVWLGHYLLDYPLPSWPLATAALMAVAAHQWPVWLRFWGGRGVAAAIGTVLALTPPVAGISIVIGGAGWALTRSSALWAAICFALTPFWALVFNQPREIVGFTAALAGLIALKRLLGNQRPPAGQPLARVLWCRLLYDRDVSDAKAWNLKARTRTVNTEKAHEPTRKGPAGR